MTNRKKLIEQINLAGRKMSTATIIFHQIVSEKAGMSGTDHKYLDLLFQEGAMAAGRLAELTGLTTGAVTGIIDRLERLGLVKRENDPNDRRKVFVVPQREKVMEKLAPIFNSLQADLDTFHDKFSEDELRIIRDYLQDTTKFFYDKARQFRKED